MWPQLHTANGYVDGAMLARACDGTCRTMGVKKHVQNIECGLGLDRVLECISALVFGIAMPFTPATAQHQLPKGNQGESGRHCCPISPDIHDATWRVTPRKGRCCSSIATAPSDGIRLHQSHGLQLFTAQAPRFVPVSGSVTVVPCTCICTERAVCTTNKLSTTKLPQGWGAYMFPIPSVLVCCTCGRPGRII